MKVRNSFRQFLSLISFMVLPLFTLLGCSNLEDINSMTYKYNTQKLQGVELLASYYSRARVITYIVSAISIGIGVLLLLTIKNNKKVKRRALFGFIIGFPILLLVILYGSGIAMELAFAR